MTLTEFLLARIAEDKADEHGYWCTSRQVSGGECDCPRKRLLAECEAKRRRVDLFARWDALCPPGEWPEGDMAGAPLSDAGRYLLRLEALPHADHSDYDVGWKP